MNRRQFATGAASASLSALAGEAAAQDGENWEPADFDEAARIELPALKAGFAGLGPDGRIQTRQLPWTSSAGNLATPRAGVRVGVGPGGQDRSTLMTGALPPGTPAPLRGYWSPETSPRPAPVWPDDERASDYRHLSDHTENGVAVAGYERPRDAGFELSAATLRFLAERNAFNLGALKRPLLVFGLRGATAEAPSGVAPDWRARHRLRVTRPDHVSLRCTIGVWRTDDDMIAIWRASTVPEASYVYGFTPHKGFGCSLLPTGFYRYRAGTHGSRKPQPGALRIDQSYVVLRTPSDLSYDPFQADDMWTQGESHNLHAGSVAAPPQYSSQGCQVIPGGYEVPARQLARGPWKGFRDACGLTLPDGLAVPAEPVTKGTYQYMLLTGLEAALFHHGRPDFRDGYRRLRHGSTGEAVGALQARLFPDFAPDARIDRFFGMTTSFAALQDRKRSEGEHTSPIVVL